MTYPIPRPVSLFGRPARHRTGSLPSGLNTLSRQTGSALAVSLMLLLVVTLVGLSSISGTILQEKMAGNMYDRQIAFQSSEAALRLAEAAITGGAPTIWHDCSLVNCVASPNPISSTWQTVASSDYDAANLGAGQPQYVIEDMGDWIDHESPTGFLQTANASQYGAPGAISTAPFYRITARSHDPDTDSDGDVDKDDLPRSVVTLQTWVKQ